MKKILNIAIGLTFACTVVGCSTTSGPQYCYQEQTTIASYGQTCERPMPPEGLGYYRTDYNYVPKPVPVKVPGEGYIMTPYPVLFTSPMVRAVEQW